MSVGWSNWDGTQDCAACEFVQPGTVAELQGMVKSARGPIRLTGAGHSWSPLVLAENGTVVNLDNLQTDPITTNGSQATLPAGIRLAKIGPQLEAKGLAMKNLGAITAQSLAGAMSTGTHGTGLRYGVLGTQAVGVTLIDGLGNLRSFNETDHPNEMNALRLSLGCLGIITSITLQCVPKNNVELAQYKLSWDECIATLPALYTDNERVRIYWFPGSDEVFVNTMNTTLEPVSGGPIYSWFEANVLRGMLMGYLWSASAKWPEFAQTLDHFQETLGYTNRHIVGPSYQAITTPIPPKHQECEVTIPLDKAPDALKAFKAMVEAKGLQANVPSEIRFTGPDDIWLSPNYQRPACYLTAYTSFTHDESTLFADFLDLMANFEARPHWGKIGALHRDQAMSIYPKFNDFANFRSQMDPNNVFVNGYIRQVFAIP